MDLLKPIRSHYFVNMMRLFPIIYKIQVISRHPPTPHGIKTEEKWFYNIVAEDAFLGSYDLTLHCIADI